MAGATTAGRVRLPHHLAAHRHVLPAVVLGVVVHVDDGPRLGISLSPLTLPRLGGLGHVAVLVASDADAWAVPRVDAAPWTGSPSGAAVPAYVPPYGYEDRGVHAGNCGSPTTSEPL